MPAALVVNPASPLSPLKSSGRSGRKRRSVLSARIVPRAAFGASRARSSVASADFLASIPASISATSRGRGASGAGGSALDFKSAGGRASGARIAGASCGPFGVATVAAAGAVSTSLGLSSFFRPSRSLGRATRSCPSAIGEGTSIRSQRGPCAFAFSSRLSLGVPLETIDSAARRRAGSTRAATLISRMCDRSLG